METTSKKPIFDEQRLSSLAIRWQQASTGEQPLIWAEIVEEITPFLFVLVHRFKTDLRPLGLDSEIVAVLALKLHKLLAHYRPDKGRFFSLCQRALANHLFTCLQKHYRYSLRYQVDSEFVDRHCPVTSPEVHSKARELREQLDRYTDANQDGFENFVARNLLVYSCQHFESEGRGRGRLPPEALERVAQLLRKLCVLDEPAAKERTIAALLQLQQSLQNLGRGHVSVMLSPPSSVPSSSPSSLPSSSPALTPYANALLSRQQQM